MRSCCRYRLAGKPVRVSARRCTRAIARSALSFISVSMNTIPLFRLDAHYRQGEQQHTLTTSHLTLLSCRYASLSCQYAMNDMDTAVGKFLQRGGTASYRIDATGALIAHVLRSGNVCANSRHWLLDVCRRTTTQPFKESGMFVNKSRGYWNVCAYCRTGM